MKNYRLVSAFLLLILIFGSCKVGKKYQQPTIALPEQILGSKDKADSSSVSDIKWWDLYSDPQLHDLIKKALENNKDLLIASKRIEEFAAGKKIAFADLFPSVGMGVLGEKESINYGGKNQEIDNTFEGKFSFAWEIDLWGKIRWANEKAKANFIQSIEFKRGVQMGVIANVAQKYFEISAAQREINIVKRTITARKEGVRLSKLRFENGLTSETSLKQSEVELARTETFLPFLEKQMTTFENELSLLMGEFPKENAFGSLTAIDTLIKDLPVGLPSQLLKRRPDIRYAEQKMIAANANVGIAFTSMFPSIQLTGSGGLESDELSTFLKSPYWLIGGGILGPVFNLGKNRTNWKRAKIQNEQEVIHYQLTVLTAFKEVNNALVAYNKNRIILEKRSKLASSARSYLQLANLQYINGITSYIDVLDAQRGMLDAEIGLSNAMREVNISLVYLYKSLGGGWEM